MTKKSMAMSMVAVLVLSGVLLLILLSWVDILGKTAESTAKDDMCKEQIKNRNLQKQLGVNLLDFFNGEKDKFLKDCEVKNVTLDANSYTNGREINMETVKEDIAQDFYRCNSLFDRGKYNPYTDWGVENVCFICSTIKFKGFDKDVDKMAEYLINNDAPLHPGMSYFEYAMGRKPTATEIMAAKNNDIPISTKGTYTNIYVFYKSTSSTQTWSWLGTGAGVGAGTGAAGLIIISFIPGVNIAFWTGALVVGGVAVIGGTTGYVVSGQHQDVYEHATLTIPYEFAKLKMKCTSLGQKPIIDDLSTP